MSRLIVAALVLLASLGGLLGTAAWNRGGQPQRVVLTERELAVPFAWEYGADPVPELRLSFRRQLRDEPQDARVWLTDTKLAELGFQTGVPAGAPGAAIFYGRSLPRVAWVVFEYDGPAWRLMEQRRATLGGPGSRARVTPSRLVPVDAGMDVETLRRRHEGASVIVMPAIVQMRYESHATLGPSVWASVSRLVSGDVSVPQHLRERLKAFRPAAERLPRPVPDEHVPDPATPRYEVVVGVGRLGAVWVEDIRVHVH